MSSLKAVTRAESIRLNDVFDRERAKLGRVYSHLSSAKLDDMADRKAKSVVLIERRIQSKFSTVPGKVASAGNGDRVRQEQSKLPFGMKQSNFNKSALGKEVNAVMRYQRTGKLPGEKSGGGSGKGRGNWGHQGRPGERGGSA